MVDGLGGGGNVTPQRGVGRKIGSLESQRQARLKEIATLKITPFNLDEKNRILESLKLTTFGKQSQTLKETTLSVAQKFIDRINKETNLEEAALLREKIAESRNFSKELKLNLLYQLGVGAFGPRSYEDQTNILSNIRDQITRSSAVPPPQISTRDMAPRAAPQEQFINPSFIKTFVETGELIKNLRALEGSKELVDELATFQANLRNLAPSLRENDDLSTLRPDLKQRASDFLRRSE